MTVAKLSPIGELLIAVHSAHGEDPAWKQFIVNATKCLAGISSNRNVLGRLVELNGPLGTKWACEEMCLKWDYFIRKHSRDKHLLPQTCFFCGRVMSKKERTRDHLWPACRGGVNIVFACKKCNSTKGAMLPEQFRLVLFGDSATLYFAENEMASNNLAPILLSPSADIS